MKEKMDESVVETYSLTCHTDDCENKDVHIELSTFATIFVCGACHQVITDAVVVETSQTDSTLTD